MKKTEGAISYEKTPDVYFERKARVSAHESCMRTKTPIALLIALGLTVAGCGDKTTEPPSPQKPQAPAINPAVLKVTQDLVLDDLVQSVEGADAVTPKDRALRSLNILLSVDAKQLAHEYDENEVAADQKYKKEGSYILVSGTVTGIHKDFKGDPYVSLQGHDWLKDVQASFETADDTKLSLLRKGQRVAFVCEIGNKIVTQVMLRKCANLQVHAQAVRGELDTYVADVLAGKVKPSAEGATLISIGYIAAQNLRAGSSCFQNIQDEACVKEISHGMESGELHEKVRVMSAKLQGL